jgi:hypothetical protein
MEHIKFVLEHFETLKKADFVLTGSLLVSTPLNPYASDTKI